MQGGRNAVPHALVRTVLDCIYQEPRGFGVVRPGKVIGQWQPGVLKEGLEGFIDRQTEQNVGVGQGLNHVGLLLTGL